MFGHSPVSVAPSALRRRSFTVTRNERGQWVARETRGLIEGVFVTQRDAVRFALYESGGRGAAIIFGEAGAAGRAA